MSAISFSGLASGLDTASLIEKLVSIERGAADALIKKQSDLNTQKSIVNSLSTAMSALATSVRAMDVDSEIRPQGVTVSDSKVAVAVSSSATPATYSLRVASLATQRVVQSKSFAANPADTNIVGQGGVDITIAGFTKSVNWDATDSLDSIAAKFNSANAGVSAAVVNIDGTNSRIVLTATNSGTAGAPTFVDTGSVNDVLSFADPANLKVAGTDAVVNLNGIDITRSSNVISDVLPGVTLTLNTVHGAADPNTTATVALDQKSVADKVKAVVAAYNSVNSALHVQLDFNGTTKGENTLFGDSALRQLQSSLATLMSNPYGASNLNVIGLSRDKTGTMTLDEAKLKAAIATDPNAVSDIFVTNGFANAVATLADQYTVSGTGIFASKTTSITSRSKSLQDQIDRINTNADALQTRLEKQFAALEQAMSQLQSQAGFLQQIVKQ